MAASAALGALIWWPANVIGDGLPLLVPSRGAAFASVTVAAMVAGNIVVFLPLHWGSADRILQASIVLGAGALIVAFRWWVVAAGMAGLAGATGTMVVWPLIAPWPPSTTATVSVGMAAGSLMSSGIMLLSPSVTVYVVASVAVEAVLLLVAMPLLFTAPLPPNPDVDHEALMASVGDDTDADAVADADVDDAYATDSDDAPPELLPPRLQLCKLLACSCLLYVVGYATPGLLPLSLSVDAIDYRLVVAGAAVADMAGRVAVSKVPPAAAVAFGVYTVCILGKPTVTGLATMWVLVCAMYTLRATAIVQLQLQLRDIGGTLHAGRMTQVGAALGATIGFVIAHYCAAPINIAQCNGTIHPPQPDCSRVARPAGERYEVVVAATVALLAWVLCHSCAQHPRATANVDDV